MMKKLLILSAILGFSLFFFVGCAENDNYNKPELEWAASITKVIEPQEVNELAPEFIGTGWYSYLALVHTGKGLPEDFSPRDLRLVNVVDYQGRPATNKYLRDSAATATEALFETALKEANLTLAIRSAYRSFTEQAELYTHLLSLYGYEVVRIWVATPGNSEHQTGLALDVAALVDDVVLSPFGLTPHSSWLAENAHRFGFIISFPEHRTADTGFMYEPWHIRFVGTRAAYEIFENNWILQDFLDYHEAYLSSQLTW